MSTGMGVDMVMTLCLHPHGNFWLSSSWSHDICSIEQSDEPLTHRLPTASGWQGNQVPPFYSGARVPCSNLSLTSGYAHVDMQSSKQGAT